MPKKTPEQRLMDLLNEKYPDETTEQVDERFHKANARRIWLVAHQGKTCSTCEEFKPLSAYGVDSREQDGLLITCKECRQERRTK